MSTSSWTFANLTGPRTTTRNYCKYCGKERNEWNKDSYIPYCSYRCKKQGKTGTTSLGKRRQIALVQQEYLHEKQIRELNNRPNLKLIITSFTIFFSILCILTGATLVESLQAFIIVGGIFLFFALFVDTNNNRLFRNPFVQVIPSSITISNTPNQRFEPEDTTLEEFFPVGEDSDNRDIYEDWAHYQDDEGDY